MAKIISIHPENPQKRMILQVVEVLEAGGIIAYPTDSGYALGCMMGNKKAMDRIRKIRKLSKHHHFTLMLKDLSHLGEYARLDNSSFITSTFRLSPVNAKTVQYPQSPS